MPATIAGLPFQWAEFTKKGDLTSPAPTFDAGVTDIVVLAHGWQTDRPGALEFYTPLMTNIVAAWAASTPAKP